MNPTSLRLLVKFPTRERPDKFFAALKAYARLCANKADTRFLFTLDTDDTTMANAHEQIREACDGIGHVVRYGPSGGKIEAVNRDLASYSDSFEWDIVLLASDDMIPQVHGYDEVIREAFRNDNPDTDGALWINDGRQQRICTIVCQGRKYTDRFGWLYHPDYKSLYCDNEWTEVAQGLGKLTFIADVLIRNESPEWGGYLAMDRLYQRNNRHYHADRQTYLNRKKAGFP